MILVNELEKQPSLEIRNLKLVIKLLAPFAPHIAEELWHQLMPESAFIFKEKWPKYKKELIKEAVITFIIQVNGKVRDKILTEAGISEEKARELAISQEKVKKWTEGKEIKKAVFIPGKLINFVV